MNVLGGISNKGFWGKGYFIAMNGKDVIYETTREGYVCLGGGGRLRKLSQLLKGGKDWVSHFYSGA